ncbi:Protein of unknown function [Desulfofustis glycolicus DSM 9705]|uniref:DUF3047 domain-containing protein n=2 Tax=Desulfofustis glycolicus TaxID=51195 RepID=A0A1M5RZ57_9BACT|nr:Protein of unknown function [Desulfofustis glycolicus DSM 9705]
MKQHRRAAIICCLFVLTAASTVSADDDVLLREEFNHLENWSSYSFRNIDRQTTYETAVQGDDSVLVAVSDASASALISNARFSVEQYPIITWRWQVERVFKDGNYRQKSGDDYPLRIYVIFEYDPQNADFGAKIKYELAKTLYGEYPPHSSINYIWANREEERETVANPFTDRAMMIPLQHGSENVGSWQEETVNVYEDYLKVFGEPPPPMASLAIMNDSDNTGESATSYLDFIEVRKPGRENGGRPLF